MSLNIGNLRLRHGVILAPMAGVTDHAFRKICSDFGVELCVSEMISAKALCYEQRSHKELPEGSGTASLARIYDDEAPLSLQIFGSEPSFMAEAASMLASGSYKGCRSGTRPAAIDINMGCPVHKVVSNREGSALMKTPELAGRIVEAVRAVLPDIPLTVKIRAGWDKDSKNALEVARTVEAAGADMVCVHGRTREQMYAPGVDLNIIGEVKAALRVPVIGNGDIYTAEDAIHMKNYTGCDGVMIARGALGAPWIFEEIISAFEGKDFTAPTLSVRMDVAIAQIELMERDKGAFIAAAEAKKHAAWYIKGIRNAAVLRDQIMKTTDLPQLYEVLRQITS